MYSLQNSINAASDCTGFKAMPSLLPLCADTDAVLLDVPSYSQTDDYSCGAIAAWSIKTGRRSEAACNRLVLCGEHVSARGAGAR